MGVVAMGGEVRGLRIRQARMHAVADGRGAGSGEHGASASALCMGIVDRVGSDTRVVQTAGRSADYNCTLALVNMSVEPSQNMSSRSFTFLLAGNHHPWLTRPA